MHARWDDEGGATAVLVAIVMLALFGAAAVAVDLGAAWETRRGLIVDTDAAALAAAQTAAETGCADAQVTAAQYLSANLGTPVDPLDLADPGNVFTCGGGLVEVGYTVQSVNAFAPAVGAGDAVEVFSSSIASYTTSTTVGGLRPIAACNHEVAIQHGLASPESLPITFDLSMVKTWKDPACNGSPGDWGWLCFDGNCGNSPNDDGLRGYLTNGYPGVVDLGVDPPLVGDEDCAPQPGLQNCETKNGKGGQSVESQLQGLVDSGEAFSILVTDDVDSVSGGQVHPWAFAAVRLDGFCFRKGNAHNSGAEAHGSFTEAQCTAATAGDPNKKNSLVFRFELLGLTTSGTAPTTVPGGEVAVGLCGIDGNRDHCPTP